ncbi:GYF domain-containing protein [Humisphaera borealis]|uniref:DUF4339 domain-containing protein n=1 Tax=Humisphaera borealis TaxID=2807512 RepID=A0A7M2WVD9_9BACT|nr:GYF domain-containing protein [Humisphaera borealis]QOV89498.1 hypothetical protein IPV69_25440 [Humisphaera borealis]
MSRQFWVIAQDGQSYGPADEATLSQWAREGRLTALSMLQDATTNQRLQASQVPSLAAVFGPQRGAAQPQGYQQSAGFQQQQTAMPVSAAYGVPQGYQQPIRQQPGYQPGYPQQVGYANPYAPAGSTSHTLTSFSTVGVVILHWVTLGVFSFIYQMMKHGSLPVRRPDDPSAGKAIGFMFIPFFNLYWLFFANLRLIDRINEERRQAGLPQNAPRGLAMAYCICMVIPYINLLVGFLIMGPIYWGTLQANVNELVRATRGPNA